MFYCRSLSCVGRLPKFTLNAKGSSYLLTWIWSWPSELRCWLSSWLKMIWRRRWMLARSRVIVRFSALRFLISRSICFCNVIVSRQRLVYNCSGTRLFALQHPPSAATKARYCSLSTPQYRNILGLALTGDFQFVPFFGLRSSWTWQNSLSLKRSFDTDSLVIFPHTYLVYWLVCCSKWPPSAVRLFLRVSHMVIRSPNSRLVSRRSNQIRRCSARLRSEQMNTVCQ